MNSKRPTLHLLGLAHTITRGDFSHCAYTMKVRKLAKMMGGLGYDIIHYGSVGADVNQYENVKQVDIVSQGTWENEFGSFDKYKYQFTFDTGGPSWQEFKTNGKLALKQNFNEGDLILSSFGIPHDFALETTPAVIEMGIGYNNTATFAPFRVYESYAWLNECRGRDNSGNPNPYHVVIPNYFDLDELKYIPRFYAMGDSKPVNGGTYFAFLGRLNQDKGIEVACMVAEHFGIKLKAFGQMSAGGESYVEELNKKYKMFEYCGTVGIKERNDFLGNAIATFVPSQYAEPFGGVAVESMLCGTPVITSDWGAFPETVQNGVSGYRCRTLKDYLKATLNILQDKISRRDCRSIGECYSLEVVGPLYDKYFKDVHKVILGKGWYELSDDWY